MSSKIEDRHDAVKLLHDIMQSVPCNSLYSLAEAVFDAGYAAPVVERQPDLVECDACPTSGGCVGKCMKSNDSVQLWSANWHMEEFYRSPYGTHVSAEDHSTRVAELQATIAHLRNDLEGTRLLAADQLLKINRLTAENERLEKEIDGANEPAGEDVRGRLVAAYGKGRWLMEYDALVAERDQFKAEIERLKGGKGEAK
jgi:cell division protein FtsB